MIGPFDADIFRALLRLGDDAEIPPQIEPVYIEFKKLRDVLDAGPVTPGEAALICMLANRKSPIDDTDTYDALPPKANPGDRVIVLWRNGRKEATYKDAAEVRGTVIVQFDDEADTREVKPERILEVLEPA